MKRETILCVTAEYATKLLSTYPLGSDRALLLDQTEMWWVPREQADHDERFRQVIPYCVLATANLVNESRKYLVYGRTMKGGEIRLFSKVAIGFGSHVDLGDILLKGDNTLDIASTILKAESRELHDEINLNSHEILLKNSYGTLYDPSSDIGKIRLRLVSIWTDFIWKSYVSTDENIEVLGWFTKQEIFRTYKDRLESWTQKVLQVLQ
jgi:predicted NUDIX family phosphoesterase